MIVSVRHSEPGVFLLTVTGAHHRHDFDLEYDNMDRVWTAARKVSEKETDYLTEHGKGWNG